MSDDPATVTDDAEQGRPSLIGTTVTGRYLIEEVIGSGGMGTVFRAQHVHMKKTLALKVLHRELAVIEEIVARFEREAIAAGRIEHPNVARATDCGRLEDGSFFLVMEFVSGRSLSSLIGEGPLQVERALYIARQIAAAIEAAHEAGIVHRDLKPDNVQLVEREADSDAVKVLDFGIAKVELAETGRPSAGGSGSSSQLTRMGSVFGTPEYMAPEQAAGSVVDHRVDLYALGVITYEMLTGQAPFKGDVLSVLTSQLTAEPPPLPDSVPPDVRALVGSLLEKEPDARVQTARDVIERISKILEDRDATARALTAPVADDALDQRPRRRFARLAAIGTIAAVLATLAIGLVLRAASAPSAQPPVLLERGAFSVQLPKQRKRAAVPRPLAAPAPAPSQSGAAPTRRPSGKAQKKPPAKEKRQTGPGGIYIPPPSEWF
jgi:eukaryotic-like serine/threonine-protein kinase